MSSKAQTPKRLGKGRKKATGDKETPGSAGAGTPRNKNRGGVVGNVSDSHSGPPPSSKKLKIFHYFGDPQPRTPTAQEQPQGAASSEARRKGGAGSCSTVGGGDGGGGGAGARSSGSAGKQGIGRSGGIDPAKEEGMMHT